MNRDSAFYDSLLRQVRTGLRAEGVKAAAIGVFDLERAVGKWKGLSENWADAELYELNVQYIVKRLGKKLRKAGLFEPVRLPSPRQNKLDPKHGVAYVTAENALLNVKVRDIRLTVMGSTAPAFPWLELGYREANRQALHWLTEQHDPGATYECELVIRLTTAHFGSWANHIHKVANDYADNKKWQRQGQPLTPELGAALFAPPNSIPPMVIVESIASEDEVVRGAGIIARTAGPVLKLPSLSREVEVPLSGTLSLLHQALIEIALMTSWWDTTHALEYVMTGHPPLPPRLTSPPTSKGGRRNQVLSQRHVALLELKHRLPESTWPLRIEQFNRWCHGVNTLRPFRGSTAQQAICGEHARAKVRATHFSTFVVPSEDRIKLEHPTPKFW